MISPHQTVFGTVTLTIMEQLDLSVKEYRDDAVKNIITKVIVLSADRIQVIFDGGAEMEVELPSE